MAVGIELYLVGKNFRRVSLSISTRKRRQEEFPPRGSKQVAFFKVKANTEKG
jgi:hypothetical protein